MKTLPLQSSEWLDEQILRIKQAYTEAHTRLGGSDASTVQDRWKLEAEIIEEAKQAILKKFEEARAASRIDELEHEWTKKSQDNKDYLIERLTELKSRLDSLRPQEGTE